MALSNIQVSDDNDQKYQAKLDTLTNFDLKGGWVNQIGSNISGIDMDAFQLDDSMKLAMIINDPEYAEAIFYKMENQGLSMTDIANDIGVSTDSLNNALGGFINNSIKDMNKDNVGDYTNEIEFLANQGVTIEQVSKLTGIDKALLEQEYPGYLPSETDKKNSNKEIDKEIYNNTKILGAPFRFNSVADPKQRYYNEHILTDLPVVAMIPGSPKIYSVKGDEDYNTGLFSDWGSLETAINNADGEGEDISQGKLIDFLLQSANKASATDERFYSFKSEYPSFKKHLNLMLTAVGVKMGVLDGFLESVDKYVTPDDIMSSAIKICVDKSSGADESLSTQFGQSAAAGMASGLSDIIKEVSFLTGRSWNQIGTADGVKEKQQEIADASKGILEGLMGGVSNTIQIVKTAISGSNIYFPEIWKDSSFSRSFNISFKFTSPYGSPRAIFEYVYVPFLTLLTFCMPRQDGDMGYMSPYIFKIDMPGCFCSDMAVATSFSFRRGGQDNLWTKDGFPLEISGSMSVKDLYPVLTMSGTYKGYTQNKGLNLYLDNMAGMSVERYDPYGVWMENLKLRTSMVSGKIDHVKNELGQWGNRFIRKMNGSFIGVDSYNG